MGDSCEIKNILREYRFGKNLGWKTDYIKLWLDEKNTVYISEKNLVGSLAYSHFQSEKGLIHMLQSVFEEPDVVVQGPDQATVYKKRVCGQKRGGKYVQLNLGCPLYLLDFARNRPGVYYSFNVEVHVQSNSVCEKIVEELYENTLPPNFNPVSYDVSSPRVFCQQSSKDQKKNQLFIWKERCMRPAEVVPEKTVLISDFSESEDESE